MSIVKDYERTMLGLLMKHPFFAKLIMTMNKDFKFEKPFVAAVSLQSTGITLHINEDLFRPLSQPDKEKILLHEVEHLVRFHLQRFKKYDKKDYMLFNIACDVAVNQYIKDFPQKHVKTNENGEVEENMFATYENLLTMIPHAKPFMHAEYYFNLIKEEQEKNGKGEGEGEGVGTMLTVDDHSEWNESDMTEEQAEKFVKGHVKAVLQGCSDKERESVDKTLIDELFKSEINWKQQLRQFFANAEETFTETTRKKRNRRYGLFQAGYKNEPKMKIGVACDTSGSMSDEALNMIFGEITRMKTENVIIYVIEADMKVHDFYEYKKGMKIAAKGRGGTAYQPAITKAAELKVDGLVYCGDCDASDVPRKPRFPVLWAINSDQNPPGDFGKIMRLPKC